MAINSVKFEDYSKKVLSKMDELVNQWLEESAGELESQTKRNTKVDTGQTKASWEHKVDTAKKEAYVGSNYMNAVWEEFGTGQYALNGDGRKTPWAYKDSKGNWHRTKGKRPRRALWNAKQTVEGKIRKRLETIMKGMN